MSSFFHLSMKNPFVDNYINKHLKVKAKKLKSQKFALTFAAYGAISNNLNAVGGVSMISYQNLYSGFTKHKKRILLLYIRKPFQPLAERLFSSMA